MSQDTTVLDVTDQTFRAEVVEASSAVPVVVDFWAPWCGPCHQLTPILERVAARHVGDVRLVKVDVDQAPTLARTYDVQGIPAVKAFKDGRVVAEFTGVQPEAVVERFFSALAPSEADRVVAAAALASGSERERLLAAALEEQPDHPAAAVQLGRILAGRGEVGAARKLLERVPTEPAAAQLLAELTLAEQRRDAGELDALRAAADAGDRAAAVAYGRALAAAGDHEEALRVLVAAVADSDAREQARVAVLDVFTVLGSEHELVRTWRPRLAQALF